MAGANLTIGVKAIGALLKEGRLQVPFNQRSYAWREKHVRNLFQDLDEEIEGGDGGEYFLGTIVLIQKGNEAPSIIDGQQRLATVSILLARIRDQLTKLNRIASASSIEEAFLTNIDRRSELRVSRLQLNLEDNLFIVFFDDAALALRLRIDYRPDTLVWNVFDSEVHTLSGGRLGSLPYDDLILATGATDRVMPVRGWTLPGVFTLGGAQVLLKEQGCLIGRRVVFCGSSPLLYLAALQYAKAGAQVVGVLDTTPFRLNTSAAERWRPSPSAWRSMILRSAPGAILIRNGVMLDAFDGTGRVEGVTFRDRSGTTRTLSCDAVAFGFGLRSETQLSELVGCDLRYDPTFRQWFPAHDDEGRCGRDVYVAGDGSKIGGAVAAELSGIRAARAVLADIGKEASPRHPTSADLLALLRFHSGLA